MRTFIFTTCFFIVALQARASPLITSMENQMVSFRNVEELIEILGPIEPSNDQLSVIETAMIEEASDTVFSVLASQDQPLILLMHKTYEHKNTVRNIVKKIRVLDDSILAKIKETVNKFEMNTFTEEIREIADSFLSLTSDEASADVSKDAEEEFLRYYDIDK